MQLVTWRYEQMADRDVVAIARQRLMRKASAIEVDIAQI